MTSDSVLERLTRLHPKVIDLSLGRVLDLLARLGDPQDRLPGVVHVAGTNGKGSVIAYLRAILEAAGRRVHVFTSPHLVRFNERVRLAGQLIADSELARVLEECESINAGRPITFFEITTAAAFLAFARHPADVLLLEVGLGGRLDATNVVAKPRVTVITPVSIDHQQYLGDTLDQIQFEKAGILKPGVTGVVAAEGGRAPSVIAERAVDVGAPLVVEGDDWTVRREGDCLLYASRGRERTLPLPALPGPHQFRNAGLALAAMDALGEAVPDSAYADGLRRVEWPARLQRLVRGSLVDLLPASWELWLDGGHNAGAAEALAVHAAASWRDRPVHLVLGMLNTRDPAAFLRPLAGIARSVGCVAIPGEKNALPGETLAAAARGLGFDGAPRGSVADALSAVVARDGPARVLVCGSLYLAGSVLRENG